MKYLMTQEEFEQLIGRAEVPAGVVAPRFTVIWFSATWCGPCRRVDGDRLERELPEVNWLKCDVDQNSYTPGFCGVKGIPAFIIVADKKVVGSLQNSDTEKILQWVQARFEIWKEDLSA